MTTDTTNTEAWRDYPIWVIQLMVNLGYRAKVIRVYEHGAVVRIEQQTESEPKITVFHRTFFYREDVNWKSSS